MEDFPQIAETRSSEEYHHSNASPISENVGPDLSASPQLADELYIPPFWPRHLWRTATYQYTETSEVEESDHVREEETHVRQVPVENPFSIRCDRRNCGLVTSDYKTLALHVVGHGPLTANDKYVCHFSLRVHPLSSSLQTVLHVHEMRYGMDHLQRCARASCHRLRAEIRAYDVNISATQE